MLDSFTGYFDLPPLEAMPIQPYWDHAAEVVGMRERHADVWAETALRFWEPPLF